MVCGVRELRRTIAQLRRTLQRCANCGAVMNGARIFEGGLDKLAVRELRELWRTTAQLRRSFEMVRDFGRNFI